MSYSTITITTYTSKPAQSTIPSQMDWTMANCRSSLHDTVMLITVYQPMHLIIVKQLSPEMIQDYGCISLVYKQHRQGVAEVQNDTDSSSCINYF